MAAITQLNLSQAIYPRITGVTYSQSSTYSSNNPATYTYMNDDNANGSTNNNQTGTNLAVDGFIKADAGSVRYIDSVIIGYDYLSNLPGGWGVNYTEGRALQVSDDDSSWTTVLTTPQYSSTGSTNGLVRLKIGRACRYIRIYKAASDYNCVLEFSLWGR